MLLGWLADWLTGWELVGTLSGAVAVWLTVRQNPWCWPLGLLNVGCYAVVFFAARLYADAGLQVVYAVLCAYGWWAWRRGGPGRGALPVRRSSTRLLVGLLGLGAVVTLLLGRWLTGAGGDLAYWDAGTATYSLIAQGLQTRKRLENWLVWIAVDAVYVGLYLVKGLQLTAALYALFLALAVAGWLAWRRGASELALAPAATV